MFQQLKNIDTAFRLVRSFSLCTVLGSFGLCLAVIYKSQSTVSQLQEKIYILSNGIALEAVAASRAANLPVEARDHVRCFHEAFFTLDPDEKVIQQNITKALYLADGSAKWQYNNLKEQGFYTALISGNISQLLTVDSVVVNTLTAPYYFRCYATQQIIRTTSIVYRRLITEGYLRSVRRSDHNPHGFLIERWVTLDNQDIKTVNR